LSWVVSL